MEKILPDPLPEIIFGSSDTTLSKAISRAVRAGKLRKLAGRVYTANIDDSLEEIVIRNWHVIADKLFPGAVLSHRTALEVTPTQDHSLFLTYRYTKKIKLPGLTIHLMKGHGPQGGDTKFMEQLYLASRPRAFLENMQISRGRSSVAKTLNKKEVEERLENLCRIYGQQEINNLRDQARKLAAKLYLKKEFKVLDKLVGAILGTRDTKILRTDRGRARAAGEPYDQHRVQILLNLVTALKAQTLANRKNTATQVKARQNLAFFEAYFSNYIEGTEFLIEEAVDIIFKHKIASDRLEDAHDVLGTYHIVSNIREMKKTPNSAEELVQLLQARHAIMMSSRPHVYPGRFKEKTNRAGETVFVAPELVRGTLKKGFEFYTTLTPGLERAIFMMFLIAEVHPFTDGNGRIARIMMNAELTASEETRIIIPTVYREDYLLALRCLSRLQDATPYVRMLNRAQQFTASIDFSDLDRALQMLRKCRAFLEPHEGKLKIF
jgi:fido (protein-threonine AMPylation protein)